LVTCGTVALMGTPNSARASLKCMTLPLPALGLLMRWSSHTKAAVLHQHSCWCFRLLSLLGSDCWSCLHGVTLRHSRKGRRWGLSLALSPQKAGSWGPLLIWDNLVKFNQIFLPQFLLMFWEFSNNFSPSMAKPFFGVDRHYHSLA
jgi:hypothetical protein